MIRNSQVSLSTMPFLKILPVVVMGILAGNSIELPLHVLTVALAVCMAAAAGWHRSDAAGIYVALSLFFFSMGLTRLNLTVDSMPKGPKLVMVMHLNDAPAVSGRWAKATAVVDRFRTVPDCSPNERAQKSSDETAQESTGKRRQFPGAENESHCAESDSAPDRASWRSVREKVIVRFDTAFHMSAGDRIIATGYAGAIGNERYEGYVRLMRRRGYSAVVWIGGGEEVALLPGRAKTPICNASRMQAAATERLSRLDMPQTAMQVAKAMSTGARSGMDSRLKESYSLTGASHLLAVSGLHVGIVGILVNLLLYLLPMFRYGHIAKNVIAIAIIWLYAMLTGLSPSILRAAMMFSGIQFAFISSRESRSMNILLATATIMLFLNPDYLYDVGFQLSFMAVLGIFALYEPLYSKVKSRFGAANALWRILIIGIAATLATMPLVSYHFGRIPLVGIFINPIVAVTAGITVLMSILWIIFPAGFLNGFFSSAIGLSSGLQNDIVEFCARKSWASLPLRLSLWQVVIAYLAAITILYLARRYSIKRKDKLSDTVGSCQEI